MKRLLRMNCFKFHMACSQKLEKKEKEGFSGCFLPENKFLLETDLLAHIAKGFSPDNLVDISNYCSFLWNLDEDAKEKALMQCKKEESERRKK